MPQVVEAHSGQSGLVQQLPEATAEVADFDWRADGRGEDEPGFMPPGSGQQPLLRLLGLVVLQGVDNDRR